MTKRKVYLIGTFDTKHKELNFVAELIEAQGIPVLKVDVSTQNHEHLVDIANTELASYHPDDVDLLQQPSDRGPAIIAMSQALAHFLPMRNDIGAVVGLGGSGGTSLITCGMRALPVGLPKLMVSTVASGNTAPYVDASDICMLYSVTDIAGINAISHTILSNAAAAIIGMMQNPATSFTPNKIAVGMTMFGVTTRCVEQIRNLMPSDFDPLVFHATGTGGRSLEKLITSGYLKHVMDITTTEVCDLLMDGVMSAGEKRMDAIIATGIPYVGSIGALDMVNFGGIDTVPHRYRDRNLYRHNAHVTLMRTTPTENVKMGQWLAQKLNRMTGPVRFLLPELGTSALSIAGQPFHDPEADTALIETLEEHVQITNQRQLIRVPTDINHRLFAQNAVDHFIDINTTSHRHAF